MAPTNKATDGRAQGIGGWRAAMSRPLWVLSAGAGMGVVLGMTVWAGTALAGGAPATPGRACRARSAPCSSG